MPQIPNAPGFGYDVAPLVTRPEPAHIDPNAYVQRGLTEFGGALQQAGNTLFQVEQAQREKDRQARQLEEKTRAIKDTLATDEAARAKSAELLNDPTLNDAQKRDKLTAFIGAEQAKVAPTYTDPQVKQATAIGFEKLRHAHTLALDTELQKQSQSKTQANIQDALELLGRSAMTDLPHALERGHALIDAQAQAAGLDAAAAEKAKQTLAEQWTSNVVEARVNTDPTGTLKDLNGGRYDALDPHRKNELIAKAQSEIEQRQNRARIEQSARLADAGRMLDSLSRIYGSGMQPKPELLAAASQAVKGTPLQAELDGLQATVVDRARFASQPLAQQATEVQDLRTRYSDVSQGATEAQASDLQWKAHQFAETVKAAETDLLQAAADRGVVKINPINIGDLAHLSDKLAERQQQASIASQWGGAPASPLTHDEATAVGQRLETATPAESKFILGMLHNAIADPAQYRATLAHIAKDRPQYAAAGVFAADQAEHGATGPDVADLILTGSHALKNKVLAIPQAGDNADKNFKLQFDTYLGDSNLDNLDTRASTFHRAQEIYAGLIVQAGKIADTTLDPDRVKQAIQLAAGGEPIEYNGKHVVVPQTFVPDFEDRVVAGVRALEATKQLPQGVTAKDIGAMPLADFGGAGRYHFWSGTGYVNGRDGLPLVLDLNNTTGQENFNTGAPRWKTAGARGPR